MPARLVDYNIFRLKIVHSVRQSALLQKAMTSKCRLTVKSVVMMKTYLQINLSIVIVRYGL